MIDASRSPRPLWKRFLVGAAVIGSTVAAGWVIWVKELHHHSIHVHALSAPTVTTLLHAGVFRIH